MSKLLDRFGVCASSLCLIHCLLTPLVIFFVPGIKGLFTEGAHHFFAAIVVAPIALAVYPHCKRHQHKDIIALAFAGAGCVLAAIAFEAHMSLAWHYLLTTLGSICLIWAHLKNIRVRHGNCSH